MVSVFGMVVPLESFAAAHEVFRLLLSSFTFLDYCCHGNCLHIVASQYVERGEALCSLLLCVDLLGGEKELQVLD